MPISMPILPPETVSQSLRLTPPPGSPATHSMNIAHIHALGPVTGIIYHEGIKVFLFHRVFKRTFTIPATGPFPRCWTGP